MKQKVIFVGIVILLLLIVSTCTRKSNFPVLKGPYLGKKPPGRIPEVFAPGIVSSENQEHSSLAFSPDGKEMWWSLWRLPHDLDKYPQVIKYIKLENDEWSKPRVAPFSGKYRDGGPAFSPDGRRIYFYSRRPLQSNDEAMHDNDIWYVERSEDGWSQPVNLGKPVNTPFVEATPCLSANGNLYFTSDRNQYDDPTGNNDLFMSEFMNGSFSEPKGLGDPINTSYARESFPYIAPDEGYIIFSKDNRKFDSDGNTIQGDRRLMISFKDENDLWRNPIDMGPYYQKARFPSVSSDGKYLFFTKYTEEANEDFYWVDANIIEELKSVVLK